MREFKKGDPTFLGATFQNGWWNFAVYATNPLISLVIGEYAHPKIVEEISLDPSIHRTGDIWHIAIRAHEEKLRWGWRVSTKNGENPTPIAIDPYAKILYTGNKWGNNSWQDIHSHEEFLLGVALRETPYPWKQATHTPLRPKDLIIYEAHVRGYTRDPSSGAPFPGTFLAMADKISHIKDLGMTAVEFMPIHEFDEGEWKKANPLTGERLYNYWGYSPLNFFAPMNRYGTSSDPLETSIELKELVESCHNEGLAVILDVVFNHTGEGDECGPAYSYKLLAEDTYYLKKREKFENFSGCGNTFNVNHPIVSTLVLDSLRHAVLEYHVDGFRFDLAAALTRSQLGTPMDPPPLIEAIIRDPIVGKCILIAEPWDAAGLYKTGSLFHLNQCHLPFLCEWNDKFRDDVRLFFKGGHHSTHKFATRMCGSQDLYGAGGSPKNSINYITSHDGFSLHDLVSYNVKHNESNGEKNQDGMNENYSWNCGHEGETKSRAILRLRDKQMKNMLTALFLSQGSILFFMGDECKSTKKGNNNNWCQDSSLSWLPWDEIEKKTSLKKCIQVLLDIRSRSGCFESSSFLSPDTIDWHGLALNHPRWETGYIGFSLKNEAGEPVLFAGFNATSLARTMEIPFVEGGWRIVANTSKSPPHDFFFLDKAPLLHDTSMNLSRFSSLVLVNPLTIKHQSE